MRPLVGLKLNERKEQAAVSQRLVPFFFWCLARLVAHIFSKFLLLRQRHIFGVFFHRRELLVSILNESYCCGTSCKHPHKIVSILLYKNGTNYCTIQQLLFVRDKINQVCLLVREVDVHYTYSWYFFGLRMHAMTTVLSIFFMSFFVRRTNIARATLLLYASYASHVPIASNILSFSFANGIVCFCQVDKLVMEFV